MNNGNPFPDLQRVEPRYATAPFAAPTAQMLPGSAPLNVFGVIQDGQYFAREPHRVPNDNNSMWRYGQRHVDDLRQDYHESQINGQFQHFYPGLPLPGVYQHFEPALSQYLETDVACGTLDGVDEEHEYPLDKPALPGCYEPPTPSPVQSESSRAVGVAEAAEATEDPLVGKEKRAKVILKKQRSQDSVTKQMGESVSIDQTATGIRFRGVYWRAPADDDTIPSSTAEINARIDALTAAIQNKEGCREKTTTGQYRNRWSIGSTYYSEDAFKAAARDLVLAMVDIHQNGWTKTIYDKGERENCQATMFYTFEDRFKALEELLRCSKTTCQDILKGTRFHTIIGNPRTLTFRTATNRAANEHKAGLIKKGKESSKTEGVTDVGGKMHNEEHSNNEEAATTAESSEPTESSLSKKSSKTLKRPHEDVRQAEEEPGDNAYRPKVATRKRRKA